MALNVKSIDTKQVNILILTEPASIVTILNSHHLLLLSN